MKGKGSFTKSHKTESTNISGGDSPTNGLLDCDETLGSNFTAILNNKAENNCNELLVEKFDFETRANDIFSQGRNANDRANKQFSEAFIQADEKEETIEEAIENFKPDSNACAIDSDTINYLVMREADYSPDPHYFDKK